MKHKQINKVQRLPAEICLGAVISLMITIIGSLVIAKLIDTEWLTIDKAELLVCTTVALSSCIGTVITMNRGIKGKWIVNVLCQAVYIAELMIITILFYDGMFNVSMKTLIAVVTGAVIAAGLKGRRKMVRKNRKIKIGNC